MTNADQESLQNLPKGTAMLENSVPPQTIIPAEVDGGAEGIIREAEQRRQTIQAEAMVNLAVGVTLMKMGDLTDSWGDQIENRIEVTRSDLEKFNATYTVDQIIDGEGGFIISVTPKEVKP